MLQLFNILQLNSLKHYNITVNCTNLDKKGSNLQFYELSNLFLTRWGELNGTAAKPEVIPI